jgi:glucokinase
VRPALEIGGSHVTAALVDPATGAVGPRVRRPLSPDAPAAELLDAIADAASALCAGPGAAWGIAMPGPFDYAAGVGRFHDVGKFESLNGVDVRAELSARITPPPGAIRFVNDADAFGIGESAWGAARGHTRAVGLTLGTGVGSAFISAGRAVTSGPDVPPEGRAHLLDIDGAPLEETVSARAITFAYGPCTGVDDVVARATAGDAHARIVIDHAFAMLGAALRPWIRRFGATVVVIGGGISAAWDLVTPSFRDGLRLDVPFARCADTEAAALRGAIA